jgi:hypothetical protein
MRGAGAFERRRARLDQERVAHEGRERGRVLRARRRGAHAPSAVDLRRECDQARGALEAIERVVRFTAVDAREQEALLELGGGSLAGLMGIPAAEAARSHRDVELNQPDPPVGAGIQIHVFDDSASLTVPYWHRGEDARSAFDSIWRYARAIAEASGYVAFDPQLGRALATAADLEAAVAAYESVVESIAD